jgi:Zn-dependent metalloprotease
MNLFLAFAMPLLALQAAEPDPGAETAFLQRVLERRPRLGLGGADDFTIKDLCIDPDGARHVRFQQRYRGLRVWGGEAILHLDAGGAESPMTDALVRGIQVEVTPNLDQAEALAITDASEAPRGSYARAPAVELLVYPAAQLQRRADAGDGRNARDFAPRVTRFHLAYHIRLELQNGAPETRHDDYLVDAHTGAILKKWSTLFTVRGCPPAPPAGPSTAAKWSWAASPPSAAMSWPIPPARPSPPAIWRAGPAARACSM